MSDFSALAVVEKTERYPPGTLFPEVERKVANYAVRYLKRWQLGVSYPAVVEEVKQLLARPPLPGAKLVIDAGGVGRAVVDMFRVAVRQGMPATITPITITAGQRAHLTPGGWTVPKGELVSVMQSLFQTGRVKVADVPERAQLIKELSSFQMKVSSTGHTSYEAITESIHDDLVIACALPLWLAEKGTRPAGSLKVINLRPKGSHVLSEKELKGKLRVVCCTNEQLPSVEIEDHTCGLIVITDPPADGEKADDAEPVHGLAKHTGTLRLAFAAHQPADHEATWNDPIPPWGKPAHELMLDVMQGKRLWAFLRDQRRTVPEIVVISAPTLDISLSVGFAICDTLHCDRQGTLYTLGMDPDETFAGDAPNLHVYARVRECRSMVV
jgi:hypothetical protein